MRKLLTVFNWLRLLYIVNGFVFGLIMGVLGNYLSGAGSLFSLKFLIPAALLLVLVIGLVELQRKRLINVHLRVSTSRTTAEKEKSARRGIIVLVSLYNPLKSSTAGKLSIEDREKAALNKDYKILDLEHSNLQPAIEGITSHRSQLEFCWLIGTTDAEHRRGSVMYLETLVEFLKREKDLSCTFFYGEDYAIALQDDVSVCYKTYQTVLRILTASAKLGLQGKDIIADYTGGIRSMVAGMVLACLHRDYDIQLMGTKYDATAKPTGELFPLHISFEPEMSD